MRVAYYLILSLGVLEFNHWNCRLHWIALKTNMYRTWDDFAVVENFGGSPEFCFIAEAKNTHEVVGFLLGESMTKTSDGTRGYIQWVAVAPPFRC